MLLTVTTPLQGLCNEWAKAVTTLAWFQWKVLDTRYAVAASLLGTMLPARPAEAPPASADDLIARAAECARKGLPPPREVYDVQYRGRIDWSQFPDWARPSDPDLFEGCGHEG